MESNASMHRVGIVLGIVVSHGGPEDGIFSGSLGFTKSDSSTAHSTSVLQSSRESANGIPNIHHRANGSEFPCKIRRLWKASWTHQRELRKSRVTRDETKAEYPFVRFGAPSSREAAAGLPDIQHSGRERSRIALKDYDSRSRCGEREVATIGDMDTQDWLGCPLISSDPEIVHGEPVFKGTRLPVETITDNVDAYVELQGQSLDEAIASTLESFPDTPGGAKAIRTVLAYREIHEHQLQL